MFSMETDQAEGLRRIMSQTAVPRILYYYSVESESNKKLWPGHIAASLHTKHHRVLLLQMAQQPDMSRCNISLRPSLLDVAHQQADLAQAVYQNQAGFDSTLFMQNSLLMPPLSSNLKYALDAIVMQLVRDYAVILLELPVQTTQFLPLATIQADEVMIQMAQHIQIPPALLTAIEQISARHDSTPLGILITGAREDVASQQFAWMHQQLQFSPKYLEVIPEDAKLKQAEQMGSAITTAFPDSEAVIALQCLAKRIQNFSISYQDIAIA